MYMLSMCICFGQTNVLTGVVMSNRMIFSVFSHLYMRKVWILAMSGKHCWIGFCSSIWFKQKYQMDQIDVDEYDFFHSSMLCWIISLRIIFYNWKCEFGTECCIRHGINFHFFLFVVERTHTNGKECGCNFVENTNLFQTTKAMFWSIYMHEMRITY